MKKTWDPIPPRSRNRSRNTTGMPAGGNPTKQDAWFEPRRPNLLRCSAGDCGATLESGLVVEHDVSLAPSLTSEQLRAPQAQESALRREPDRDRQSAA